MDGQQYLNQIAESNRPLAKPNSGGLSGLLSSKFFIVGAIGVGLLVLIVIIGAAMGGGKGSEQDQATSLLLHVNNTSEVIREYQPNIKSSALRSSSGSLSGVLSNTSHWLNDYLEAAYGSSDKDIDKTIVEEATLAKDGLSNELFEAKINGILDRIYAHKMAYEITLFITEEDTLLNKTNSEELQEILIESRDSLTNLYDKFNDFSETK